MQQHPFSQRDPSDPASGLAPMLPLKLTVTKTVLVRGLLDTGSTVNVLTHYVGLQMGADWDAQIIPLQLTGNLAALEARVLMVMATVGNEPPVRLAFAWAESNDVPLLLGQVNFFMEFDVCFFRYN